MGKLSEFLRQKRLSLNMSQEDFAKKCDLSYVSIIRVEKGRRVGFKVINNIAEFLKMSPAELRKMSNEDNE